MDWKGRDQGDHSAGVLVIQVTSGEMMAWTRVFLIRKKNEGEEIYCIFQTTRCISPPKFGKKMGVRLVARM